MKKKLIATAMLAIPVLGLFEGADVLAATRGVVDTEDITGPSNGGVTVPTNGVDVYINQPSTFTVTIPKEIELQASGNAVDTYVSDYEVTVTGNISANQVVTVIPNSTFVLTQTGKSDLNATIVQQETNAAWNEINTQSGKKMQGSIEVPNVTAGNWTGSFNFNISLK